MNPAQMVAFVIVLLPVGAMFIDMYFHQRLLKKLRKEAATKKGSNQ